VSGIQAQRQMATISTARRSTRRANTNKACKSPGANRPTRTFAFRATSGVIVEGIAVLDSVAATDRGNPTCPAELFPGDRGPAPVAANGRDDQLQLVIVELLQRLSERSKLLRERNGVSKRARHDAVEGSTKRARLVPRTQSSAEWLAAPFYRARPLPTMNRRSATQFH
jgi:hypothetical protein